MSEYLNIGSSPFAEDCLQVGDPNQKKECQRYKRQLERQFPQGIFGVKGFDHDFGRYYEVVAYMEDDESSDAAFAAEAESWEDWRDQSIEFDNPGYEFCDGKWVIS